MKPSLLKKSELRLQIIEFVKLHQPTTTKAIAQFLGVGTAGLTATMQALFRHGYLTRLKSNQIKTIKNTFYYWSLSPHAVWSVPFLFEEEKPKRPTVKVDEKKYRTALSSVTQDHLDWMNFWAGRRKIREQRVDDYQNLTKDR